MARFSYTVAEGAIRLSIPRVVKIEISRRCWRGNPSVLARFFGGDMSVPRALSILATPGSIPTSLDVLVDIVRDVFGLGSLIVGDESPYFSHVPLVILLVSDVNDTRLLIFVHVERPSIFDSLIKLIWRQGGVKVALPFRLRDASQKATFRYVDSLGPLLDGPATVESKQAAD
jgi:hypothetical protein